MDDATMQQLKMGRDPAEKAAIIAEYFFEGLPNEVVIVARYCVLLHWFDQTIVEALLEETTLSKREIEEVYEQLVALPFVERLPWGQKFQDLTREGLLARYVRTDQEILKKAAYLAAPAYEARKENKKVVAEALFCHIIAGDQYAGRNLLNALQEEAANNADWHYLGNLLRLQEEAEKFPFVRPLPRGEQDWMAQGTVHQFQGRLTDAITDYDRVLTRNPKNAFAYVNRGTIYAEQERYEMAISDYNVAIELDPTLSQVYINRGIIYEKKEQYIEALHDFEIALQQAPQLAFLWCNKGAILRKLGRYEEALAAYEEALRLDPYSVDKDGELSSERVNSIYNQNQHQSVSHPKRGPIKNAKIHIKNSFRLKVFINLKNLLCSPPASSANFAESTVPVFPFAVDEKIPVSLGSTLPAPVGPHRAPTRKGSMIGAVLVFLFVLISGSLSYLTSVRYQANAITTAQQVATVTASARTSTAVANAGTAAASTAMARSQATAAAVQENPPPAYFSGNGTLALDDPLTGSSSNSWVQATGSASSPVNGNCMPLHKGLDVSVGITATNGVNNVAPNVRLHSCIKQDAAQPSKYIFSDFAYEVTMTINQGDCGGVVFRATDQAMYYFVTCKDGTYRLVRYKSDSQGGVTLIPPAGSSTDPTSSAINMGLTANNTIAIEAKGTHVDLYVNETKIDSIGDPSYSSGYIGVLAESLQPAANDPTDVTFTNARLWRLS